ncbi:GNAT family N-acetyltransferase [Microbacterium allomyrinae]|uniref:GNAT family N-acetyltransferase n=1 Tax=Microbacterium allomyrinae TaxID=2830666 RepID=A0A9X1S3L5_9MICO|nr:GNAT family N-acetyltransferase [Microbacterium allomyrinae]MCC2032115.1 GNAT family N-acetyltransferase [Microbacterium allomyrinae]
MTASTDPRVAVRRIRADEWQAVRALRVEATNDPDASIAFLESPIDVASRTDQFWQERSSDAAESEVAAQFVAIVRDVWVGSASVLVRATGQVDHLGRYVDDRRADVVGVYVSPSFRGSGAIDLLLTAAAEWAGSLGLAQIFLDVHRDNARAQAAYRRCGFAPTGETLSSPIGPEIVMGRALPRR